MYKIKARIKKTVVMCKYFTTVFYIQTQQTLGSMRKEIRTI